MAIPDEIGQARVALFADEMDLSMDEAAAALTQLSLMGGTCRVCGCTDDRACNDDGRTCHWADKDLCSFCHEMTDGQPMVGLYDERDLDAMLWAMRRGEA